MDPRLEETRLDIAEYHGVVFVERLGVSWEIRRQFSSRRGGNQVRLQGDFFIPVPGVLEVAVFPSRRALEIEHRGLVIEDLEPDLASVVFRQGLTLDILEPDALLVTAGLIDREPQGPV